MANTGYPSSPPPPPPTAPHAPYTAPPVYPAPPPQQPPMQNPIQAPPPVVTDQKPGKNNTPVAYGPPPGNLGSKPTVLVCPQCQHRGPSNVSSDNCTAVNWACTLIFCLCCFFCIPATAKHTHSCAKCGGYLGSNNIV